MSERLADVGRRIATVQQLGGVVNAMRGIAGARAQQARTLLPAICAYADTAARAIGQARRLETEHSVPGHLQGGRSCLIVFGAGQGFAGAFPERVLDALTDADRSSRIFLIGERSAAIATERGFVIDWQSSQPHRAALLPALATAIVDALYEALAEAGPVAVTMVYPVWTPERSVAVLRRSLLPLDPHDFPSESGRTVPLVNLPAAVLIERLAQEYLFARLCEAATECFTAENEARMMNMAAAKSNIDGKLAALQLEERLTRQDEITAEVVELAASGQSRRRNGVA